MRRNKDHRGGAFHSIFIRLCRSLKAFLGYYPSLGIPSVNGIHVYTHCNYRANLPQGARTLCPTGISFIMFPVRIVLKNCKKYMIYLQSGRKLNGQAIIMK